MSLHDQYAQEAAERRKAAAAPRDWPEDFDHENGNYTCKCCICGEEFIGHKRRVACKVCHDKEED